MENPKTYTQLLVIAVEVMQANNLEEVFATEDGQIFYEKNRAQLHASTIESRVYTFDNSKTELSIIVSVGATRKLSEAELVSMLKEAKSFIKK